LSLQADHAVSGSTRERPAAQAEDAVDLTLSFGQRAILSSVIVTGLLAAIAISIAETAPLLLTAGWAFFDPAHQLTKPPVAFLTHPVWTSYATPYQAQQHLAYDAALLLFVLVLIVIIMGRVVVTISRRHAE
jgi:ABC-type phosphate transport system permease subunit